MKNTFSVALLAWSLTLGSGKAVAWEQGTERFSWTDSSSRATLVETKTKTNILLNKNESDSVVKSKKEMEEILSKTLENIENLTLNEEEKKNMIAVMQNPYFQEEFYSFMKKEKIWSPESVVLSLLLWLLYAWAYFSTIRKIHEKWMPIDIKSFSIFGWTSGMMAFINGFVPWSSVYAISFVLAFTSVYLDRQNRKKGVSYEDGLFDRFANNIPLPTVRYNHEGFPLVWNSQMEDESGYTHDEIKEYYRKNGSIMKLLYRGENLGKVEQYIEQMEETGEWYVNVAFTMTTKSGEEKTFLWSTIPDGNGGTMRMAKHLTDIREIHTELERTRDLLRKDALTGAYNRLALDNDLHKMLTCNSREKDPTDMIMFFLDIDDFKNINDAHGHDVGDTVLVQLVKYIKENMREGDKVYRYGGDEFVVLVGSENFYEVSQKINDIRRGFFREKIPGRKDKILSVGTSWWSVKFNTGDFIENNNTEDTIRILKKNADRSMYAVKYYRLIQDILIQKGKIKNGQSEKNGLWVPRLDEKWALVWIEVFSEYAPFLITAKELGTIEKMIEENPKLTNRKE